MAGLAVLVGDATGNRVCEGAKDGDGAVGARVLILVVSQLDKSHNRLEKIIHIHRLECFFIAERFQFMCEQVYKHCTTKNPAGASQNSAKRSLSELV